MRPNNPILFNTVSGATTIESAAIPTQFMLFASAQATFSSNTMAGAFKLQASDDNTANLPAGEDPQTWIDIPNTSQTVTAGGAVMIPFTQICYAYVRAVWTPSAGTGNITATGFFQGAN